MNEFTGFPEGKMHFTGIPDLFFRSLLPEIDHLGELKTTIYAFRLLHGMEGAFRYLRRENFSQDPVFMQGLAEDPEQAGNILDQALSLCIERKTFLRTSIELETGHQDLYFLNSPKGRTAIRAVEAGEWRHSGDADAPVELVPQAPNIYILYEENIGPLTPMIADTLQEAEQSYPYAWIEEAVRIAVENNVRRWTYVEAILKRWQEGGRDERTDRRDTEKDRRRYVEGEFSDFIEH
ncbi:MAG: DnaD domain protein [Anaerolineales bacterium]|nr:DnaD domain protein [Anaerolineales bacterium]